jgi:hypothetical protein
MESEAGDVFLLDRSSPFDANAVFEYTIALDYSGDVDRALADTYPGCSLSGLNTTHCALLSIDSPR